MRSARSKAACGDRRGPWSRTRSVHPPPSFTVSEDRSQVRTRRGTSCAPRRSTRDPRAERSGGPAGPEPRGLAASGSGGAGGGGGRRRAALRGQGARSAGGAVGWATGPQRNWFRVRKPHGKHLLSWPCSGIDATEDDSVICCSSSRAQKSP